MYAAVGEIDPSLHSLLERIESDFTYHAPTPETIPLFTGLREGARRYARAVAILLKPGREQSTALTHMEMVTFFANAGLARQGPRPGAQLLCVEDENTRRLKFALEVIAKGETNDPQMIAKTALASVWNADNSV